MEKTFFPIKTNEGLERYLYEQKKGMVWMDIIQKDIDKAHSMYYKVLEERLLDLYRKEIDPSIKVFSAEMNIDSNLSIFELKRNVTLEGIDQEIGSGVFEYKIYMPEIIGFINNSTGQMYILDEFKKKFCLGDMLCKKNSCKSCKDFICNINGI